MSKDIPSHDIERITIGTYAVFCSQKQNTNITKIQKKYKKRNKIQIHLGHCFNVLFPEHTLPGDKETTLLK